MKNTNFIHSVNFHLTKACNMKCGYCFAEFKQISYQIKLNNSIKILEKLRSFGFDKINFVGGEPFLIKGFAELLKYAKQLGFYTSVVTNGSFINDAFLKQNHRYIDMIGISVDSLISANNKAIGRYSKNFVPDRNFYNRICKLVSAYNIDLKINTVVSKYNLDEDFTNFILSLNPIRWKVFQVLGVENENDIKKSKISTEEFETFIKRHESISGILISESNNILKGSYIMIDPNGCFFDNSKGEYTVSDPILNIGVQKAIEQVNFDCLKFTQRKGDYYEELNIKKLAS